MPFWCVTIWDCVMYCIKLTNYGLQVPSSSNSPIPALLPSLSFSRTLCLPPPPSFTSSNRSEWEKLGIELEYSILKLNYVSEWNEYYVNVLERANDTATASTKQESPIQISSVFFQWMFYDAQKSNWETMSPTVIRVIFGYAQLWDVRTCAVTWTNDGQRKRETET